MPIFKAVVTDLESSPTTKHLYPYQTKLKLEGDKKPDTLEAIFGMQDDIDQNYEIKFLQDIVDTSYLRGAYQMQLSALDESGYNHDPTDPAESRFVKVSSGRFKGNYALDFASNGQGVSVASANTTNIDISKQFDIWIWFTPNTTQLHDGSDEPILWSFYSSGNTGLEIGITGNNGTNSSWKVFLRYGGGSAVTQTGANTGKIMTGYPVLIRVKRDDKNVLKAFVNGQEEISTTVTTDFQPSSTAMTFGDASHTSSSDFKGQIHAIRVYGGACLNNADSKKLRLSKPVVQIMKFNGRVRKVVNEVKRKKVKCQSISWRFTAGRLGVDVDGGYTWTVDDNYWKLGEYSSQGGSGGSWAGDGSEYKTILQSAVDEIDSDFKVRVKDTFVESQSGTPVGYIYQVGSFMQFAQILLLLSKCIMYITPRNNIIIESEDGHDTDYIFDQNGSVIKYNILDTEDNDTKLVNEVIFSGRSGTSPQRYNNTPSKGVRRTLRGHLEQISSNNDLDLVATAYAIKFRGDLVKDISPKKYIISSKAPFHHVRYNHVLKELKRKQGQTNLVLSGGTAIIVRQLEFNYPSGVTLIKAGENDIDYFDDNVKNSRVQEGLTDSELA